MSIAENLRIINEKIRETELKSGRKPESVKLMAVSKFHPSECVVEAIKAGQTLFGENRVQEATEKFPEIFLKYPETKLHMIGQLQSNKARNAVKIADCIQSVDSLKLIKEIEKQCTKQDKFIKILMELHTGEDTKSGFETEKELLEALNFINDGNCPHITVNGLMTMAPFTDDKDKIRYSFASLKNLFENIKSKYNLKDFTELSMGMSGDYELAIEEGSTLVRIGTAIFGERQY